MNDCPDEGSNRRLITWSFGYHNRLIPPLLVDIKAVFVVIVW